MLQNATAKFASAHDSSPTCSVILHRWALAHEMLGRAKPEEKLQRYEKAEKLFERSLRYWSTYTYGIMDYLEFLRKYAQLVPADSELYRTIQNRIVQREGVLMYLAASDITI